MKVNAAVSFQNSLAIENTSSPTAAAMAQHRSNNSSSSVSKGKQQLSDDFREPSFEVFELSVMDLDIVFHSWKTLNKGGE